jgi:DNA-binding NtrC family response regulator
VSETIISRTTAEVDIRNLTDVEPDRGRASIIFHCGDKTEVAHLEPPRDEVTVGRTFPADVVVDLASLSRQHARFSWANNELFVEDLGSRNGTWVGEERIDRRRLFSGDQVKLGGLVAVVAISTPRKAEEPPGGMTMVDGALVVSARMRELYETVERIANNAAPVLILGETGTGKELVARSIHTHGSRSPHPFRVVNCGAIPENLSESLLFGHEKGAFTGADRRSRGVFEQAQQGTVFLDEIGELPLETQVKLLRALETKKVCRVGGSEEIEVDVRVVAATHCDVEAMVEEGSFRQDLLYRLNTFVLRVPPLRERVEEIEPLCKLFMTQSSRDYGRPVYRIVPEALQRIKEYGWPGNIRQLRNVVERGVLLCEGDVIRVEDLPRNVAEPPAEPPPPPPAPETDDERSDEPLKEQLLAYEKRVIAETIERTGGNQRAAARILRMPYRTMARKVKKYGLRGSDSRDA